MPPAPRRSAAPGIARLWFALDNGLNIPREQRLRVADPLFLRKTVLQIYWDDADHPSVEVPVGDFFGVGSGEVRSYSSALIEVSAHQGAGRGSLTSWIRMPFFERARFVLRNDGELPVRAFWHIDHQRWDRLPADTYHFHSSWRCEMPCSATPLEADGSEGPNLTGERNYVILDATGEGTYYGCHLTVDNHAGGWWGEGDDMVFVDGEPFPAPSTAPARRNTSAKRGECRTSSTPTAAPRCSTMDTRTGKAAGRCIASTCSTRSRSAAASA